MFKKRAKKRPGEDDILAEIDKWREKFPGWKDADSRTGGLS
jgi:hypothetical protein